MKYLIYDVETTTMDLSIRAYQLKNYIKYFNPDDIVRDWTMLGAAWMDLEHDKPTIVAVDHKDVFNDEQVVRKLHAALDEADCLIGHNERAFDFKKFNTRAIYYNLPPISPKLHVDTLCMARKYFKFSSNKLSYLCKFLDVGEFKDSSPDWDKILQGCKKSLNYMKKYNGQDVVANKALYLRLKSYDHQHPVDPRSRLVRNADGTESVLVCKYCLSPDIVKAKPRPLTGGRQRQQWRCKEPDCLKYMTTDLVK